MKRLFSIIFLAITASACSAKSTVNNSTVPALNLNKYLGRWYEIARFDHSFERNQHFTMADYTLQNDGMIRVVNSGMKNGRYKESVGKAKTTNVPGLMRVSFFGPFYSDYRVLMVTPDYQQALVGSKSPDYLWILSRTPSVPAVTMDAILSEARSRGYNTDHLIWVMQDE